MTEANRKVHVSRRVVQNGTARVLRGTISLQNLQRYLQQGDYLVINGEGLRYTGSSDGCLTFERGMAGSPTFAVRKYLARELQVTDNNTLVDEGHGSPARQNRPTGSHQIRQYMGRGSSY